MDPYELFSTPPADAVFSSTPKKQTKERGAGAGDRGGGTRKTAGGGGNRSDTENGINGSHKKIKKVTKKRTKKDANLWDKCIKENPELAQFVDCFNNSLEEALSKPLDMS